MKTTFHCYFVLFYFQQYFSIRIENCIQLLVIYDTYESLNSNGFNTFGGVYNHIRYIVVMLYLYYNPFFIFSNKMFRYYFENNYMIITSNSSIYLILNEH